MGEDARYKCDMCGEARLKEDVDIYHDDKGDFSDDRSGMFAICHDCVDYIRMRVFG